MMCRHQQDPRLVAGWRLPALPRVGRCARGAFTAVELVIVALVLAIMAAVAVPRFADTLAACQTDAAAHRIKMDLELARRSARMTSTPRSVVFNRAASSYRLPGVAVRDFAGREYGVNLRRDYGVVLVELLPADADEVSFDGHGVPRASAAVTVRSGASQRTVQLLDGTGEVRIE